MAKHAHSPKESSESFVRAHREAAEQAVQGIGELARELGTTPRAIRFYETKGLLAPGRVGSTRIYGRRERARLQLILRAKALGLPLREIKAYLDLYGEHGEGRRKQLEVAVRRAGEMIAELEAKRDKIDETLDELRLIRRESQKKLLAAR